MKIFFLLHEHLFFLKPNNIFAGIDFVVFWGGVSFWRLFIRMWLFSTQSFFSHYIFSNYSVYIIFVGSLGVLNIISFSLNSILCPLYTWPFLFPSSYPFTLCSAKISQVCFPREYLHHWMCSLLPGMKVSLFLYCFSSLSLLRISPISLSISLGISSSWLALS